MKSFLVLPALLALVSGAVIERDAKVSYDGYKVFRVDTKEGANAVLSKLASLADKQTSHSAKDFVDIAVAPKDFKKLESLGLKTTVINPDLAATLREETIAPYSRASTASTSSDVSVQAIPDSSWFNAYHSFADHQQYIRDIQASFPNSELISSGTSYQNRNLLGIHLWGSGGKDSKPAILFHGTVHAREWITTMTVEYILYQLVTGYNKDTTVTSLLNKYDFYIVPVVNPDGFVYSQTNDRLWRKNRQPGPSSGSCVGRDINRNWPYQWNSNPDGASTNPCDQTYKGQAQGDAPENKGLVSLVQSLKAKKGIKLYVDWHSYGQYILGPYGYDCNRLPANQASYQSLAKGTADTIKTRYGTQYTYGPSCSTLYATTGSSTDYVGDVGGAQYAITIELRDKGNNGFTLPASQIRPTGEETWDGIKYYMTTM